MEFERDTIISYETVTEVTLCQEETLESIVPDACPDILRIVDVCGQAMLSGKQAREGVAQVTGMVRAVILYQPEGGGGLRRMEVGLPFTCQAEAPGLTEQGTVRGPGAQSPEGPAAGGFGGGYYRLPAGGALRVQRRGRFRGGKSLPETVPGRGLPALYCTGETLYIL